MAGTRDTRVCFGCKEKFRIEEMIGYAGPKASIPHWYCKTCLKEKKDRDHFSDRICEIFGIKTPGPRIWTERKRIQNTYGYTDDVIIDCLEYMYNVKHFKKYSESLALVTPMNVYNMKKWKQSQENKVGGLIAAMIKPIEQKQVEVQENTHSNKQTYNLDDFLDE